MKKKEESKRKNKKASLKKALRIFAYIKPFRLTFAIGFVFLFLTGATALIFPKIMGDLVDSATAATSEDINRFTIILLIVFMAQAIFSYFRIYLFAIVTQKALAKLRNDVYAHIIKLPMSFFTGSRVGELNSRISSDISLLQTTFTTTMAEFLRQLIIILGGIVLLSYLSIQLTLFMLAVVPILALAAVFFGKFIRVLSKDTQKKVADSNTIVEETFQSIDAVKSYANEWYEIGRYAEKVRDIVKISLKAAKWRGAFVSFIIFAIFSAIVGVIWRGTTLVQSGADGLTIGKLISFLFYTVFIGASIGGIAQLYSQIQSAIGATEHLLDLMEEEAEPITIKKLISNKAITGNVSVNNVGFFYPSRKDQNVLANISFSVKSGQQVAIVGPSGSGKSTLVSLLLRHYNPTTGSISVDGKLIMDYDLSEYRNQLAVVPQEVILFGGSIKENIAYGKPDASDEEIIAAARKANAKEFIESFPDKFETLVGDRGVQLSGGQRQRIAIARAVLKDPSILFLDEATSSLDSESEQVVQNALEELMKGRTSFVIAHRLSTIQKADLILVVKSGKVVESGTHDELISKDGVYKSLCALQFNL